MADHRIYWLALNLVLGDNLGPAQRVAERFAPLEEAFRAGTAALRNLGLSAAQAARLSSASTLDQAARDLERAEKKGIALLLREDADYPPDLREIYDPPPLLMCAGRADALSRPGVAVVGSRRPSPYGRAVAERLARDLAGRGLVVTSGLALGIDAAAHWGALRGGRTVAVLGSGLNVPYPKENRKLMETIVAGGGAVVSEFALDAQPLAFHFPLRNRVISGLSRALVVVEAARRSGSLISARLALEQNREVMAVPGNVTSELSAGTNALIQAGAKLVRDWTDVAAELPPPLRDELLAAAAETGGGDDRPQPGPESARVLALLREDALAGVDELVERTGCSVSEILTALLDLELKGWVAAHPGQRFQRRP
ncbi:MAG: DNA-processing protein DprA [Candidatus Aminicenantes bacterium]|nr:DNA-processing protein DprA [Candidatus Aminicenantes bacterium]